MSRVGLQFLSGLADTKGMCSYYGASVIHEGGEYAIVNAATHEMAHRLVILSQIQVRSGQVRSDNEMR